MRKEGIGNLKTTEKIGGRRDRDQQQITFVKSLCHLLNITIFQLLQSLKDRYFESFGATLYTNGSDVKVHSYSDAIEYCRETGGEILQIFNEKQQNDVATFLKSSNFESKHRVLLGLKREDFLINKFFSVSKPKDFLRVDIEYDDDGKFLSIRKDAKFELPLNYMRQHFICSKSRDCSTEKDCFDIIKIDMMWYEARSFCARKGEDLFNFHDKFGATELATFLEENERYWLGYSNARLLNIQTGPAILNQQKLTTTLNVQK
ncbi:hypothetical protein HELRODRAFT_182030 [Helobdella robusta]|uniref:C-type lectin domain-containing protein n=1 Tax=Helobdella robusta TaxID=6412 RepID=T1FHM0_HELRO|nr:hypothetical protein HELRODRAFT_182030 [Helobdella robusta]ESN91853.1 hypothetical protein HELRODRAFT_182030 [Helobdella robusta]